MVVDEWSRRSSLLHRRDARAKILALLLVLVAISASTRVVLGACALLTAAGVLFARLPVPAFLLRSSVVLPFAGTLALVAALTGDPTRAGLLLVRSWISTCAILVIAATTPLPRLLDALRRMRVPSLLLEVIQFVYRYLFVLAEQVWRMRTAALARGGHSRYAVAVRTVTVLFARSYERAERIHFAMLSRGYSGELPTGIALRLGPGDYGFVAAISAYLAAAFFLNGTAHLGS